MHLEFSSEAYRHVHNFFDQSRHFDSVRCFPVISSITGLAETVLNTTLVVATLPVVGLLQAIQFVPFVSEKKHTYLKKLAKDSLRSLVKLISNVSIAIISSVPFAGNFAAWKILSTTARAKSSDDQLQTLQRTLAEKPKLPEEKKDQIPTETEEVFQLKRANKKFEKEIILLKQEVETINQHAVSVIAQKEQDLLDKFKKLEEKTAQTESQAADIEQLTASITQLEGARKKASDELDALQRTVQKQLESLHEKSSTSLSSDSKTPRRRNSFSHSPQLLTPAAAAAASSSSKSKPVPLKDAPSSSPISDSKEKPLTSPQNASALSKKEIPKKETPEEETPKEGTPKGNAPTAVPPKTLATPIHEDTPSDSKKVPTEESSTQ